jgi:large subunit ribosomal protein L9
MARIADNTAMNENKIQGEAAKYHKQQEIAAAKALAEKLEGKSVTLKIKCGSNGKTFGSITSKEIADQLQKIGISLDKKKIDLKDAIKASGSYSVVAKVYPEITAKFTVVVEAE